MTITDCPKCRVRLQDLRYDGHNRSNHPKTSMKDIRQRRTRRKTRQVWRAVARTMGWTR